MLNNYLYDFLSHILRKDTKNQGGIQAIEEVYWQYVRYCTVFSLLNVLGKRGQIKG